VARLVGPQAARPRRPTRARTEALEGLIATHDQERYANDRYWALLGPEGMLPVFRRKMGFQASSFSDIEGRHARYLD
jgi:hypothetical protein